MLFWIIAIAVTAIACAALFYASSPRAVNATHPDLDESNSHFRLVLAGIDADQASGKLGDSEALAAKGELAREILRHKADAGRHLRPVSELGRMPLLAGLAATALVSFGLYATLGHPDLPAQPLAGRTEVAAQSIDLGSAIARIETALAAHLDDLRGWTVIAPAYVELGRYEEAARAYRRVIDLGGATPDLQTSLAEALLLEANGAGSPEAVSLLQAAIAADPQHVMSRLYLASELTAQARYAEAVPLWNAALALSQGNEPWLPAARQGLAVAENDGVAPTDTAESKMIASMVGGLERRLTADGGTIEEWTQLVRAYIVLGDTQKAQAAYTRAVAAYPQTFDRGELDTLALGAGLSLNGAAP